MYLHVLNKGEAFAFSRSSGHRRPRGEKIVHSIRKVPLRKSFVVKLSRLQLMTIHVYLYLSSVLFDIFGAY